MSSRGDGTLQSKLENANSQAQEQVFSGGVGPRQRQGQDITDKTIARHTYKRNLFSSPVGLKQGSQPVERGPQALGHL